MSHPRITAEEAHRLMTEQGYFYLDVRTEEEFAQGHPAGAYNVPVMLRTPSGMQENPRFLQVMNDAFAKDQKLVLGCKAGSRSLAAAKKLIGTGYVYVAEQRAGWSGQRDPFGKLVETGWEAAGLPCATAPEPGRDYVALSKPR